MTEFSVLRLYDMKMWKYSPGLPSHVMILQSDWIWLIVFVWLVFVFSEEGTSVTRRPLPQAPDDCSVRGTEADRPEDHRPLHSGGCCLHFSKERRAEVHHTCCLHAHCWELHFITPSTLYSSKASARGPPVPQGLCSARLPPAAAARAGRALPLSRLNHLLCLIKLK